MQAQAAQPRTLAGAPRVPAVQVARLAHAAPRRGQRAPSRRSAFVGGGGSSESLAGLASTLGTGLAALLGAAWLQRELQQQVRPEGVLGGWDGGGGGGRGVARRGARPCVAGVRLRRARVRRARQAAPARRRRCGRRAHAGGVSTARAPRSKVHQ